MLIYLKHARQARGETPSREDITEAVREGALLRVRPKAMTVAVIIAGLLPILVGSGAGSEVMRRIAAPMVGGMLTAPLLSMFVIPAAYLLIRRHSASTTHGDSPANCIPTTQHWAPPGCSDAVATRPQTKQPD